MRSEGELLYRFGAREDFYLAGRYNAVSGKMRVSLLGLVSQGLWRKRWFLSKALK
jgi:hypothetical protein